MNQYPVFPWLIIYGDKERTKRALNYALVSSDHKFKNQNYTIPKLENKKQKMIDSLNKKQKNSSRTELINNLNKKLHENNSSEYQNLYQMSLETTTNDNLYNIENDKNLISNNEQEKKLNESNKENTKKQYIIMEMNMMENGKMIKKMEKVKCFIYK